MSQATFRVRAEDHQPQPSTDQTNHHGYGLYGDGEIDYGSHSGPGSADESLGPPVEDPGLQEDRLYRFITDRHAPLTISAEKFHQDRKQALARIDGMVACLKFLDKMERHHGVLSADQTEKMLGGLPPRIAKALRWVLSLRRAMQADFQRFNHIASMPTSPILIRDLCGQFPSSRALIERGALVKRDALDGRPPDTLADIFALFSLFRAQSSISVHRTRMEEAQVPAEEVLRWGRLIRDVNARDAFDILATAMWPPGISPSSQNLPGTSTFEILSANPERDLHLVERDLTSALLPDLGGSDEDDLGQRSNDPKDLSYFVNRSQLLAIPGYNPSPHSHPANQAITLPRPFPSDMSECFYLLSGRGMTVADSRTGPAHASERSKTEWRLRETFFGPLKKMCRVTPTS